MLDEPPLVSVLVLALDEVVSAEFVIWLLTLQNVIGDHEDGMRDGDDGFVVPVAAFDPRVLIRKSNSRGVSGGRDPSSSS